MSKNKALTLEMYAVYVRSAIQSQIPQEERTHVQMFVNKDECTVRYKLSHPRKINKKLLPVLDGATIKEL